MSAIPNRAYSHPRLSKAAFIAELRAHAAADRIVQGGYWNGSVSDGRGCAVGCSINSAAVVLGLPVQSHEDYAAYERLLGIPRLLAALEDTIFESLTPDEATAWLLRFSTAIPEGADLSGVWNRFAPWLLREIALPTVAEKHTRQRAAIIAVAEGFETGWTNQTQKDANRTAYVAAHDAYKTADDAYAPYAAYAASIDPADTAYAVAYAAACHDARTSARRLVYSRISDKLCEMLAEAPVPAVAEVRAQVQPVGEE